jgi:hypothetical protein
VKHKVGSRYISQSQDAMRFPRRKLIIIGTAMLLIAGLWIGLKFTGTPQVIHKGKTVREWVLRIDQQAGNEKQREEASWAIVQIGQPAVPELEEILMWRPHTWRDTLRPWLIRFHIIKPDQLNSFEIVNRACEAAYNLGERTKSDLEPLVPHLEFHFTNGTYADSASSRALASAGPRGICILTNLLLFSASRHLRDQAGWALHHVSRRPEVIVALIRAANTETNASLRANALGYLRSSRAPPEKVVPLALEFLRSTNAYDRRQARWVLSGYKHLEEVRAALAEAEPR